jgi:XisI protein
MDRLENYRSIIKQLLEDYRVQGLESDDPGTDRIVIADATTDNYLLLNVGWWQGKRITGATLHLRLLHGKIQIEEDWTEKGITADLLQAGISRDEIVLAFHSPETRKYTEFATA